MIFLARLVYRPMTFIAWAIFFVFLNAHGAPSLTCKKLFSANEYYVKAMSEQQRSDDRYEYKTVYYTLEERAAFEIHVGSNGLLLNSKNEILNLPEDQFHIFVMDKSGRIFVKQEQFLKPGRHHHSSFLAGEPVAAAGGIKVKDGFLTFLDNGSGHYSPELPFLKQMIIQLGTLNANLDRLSTADYKGKPLQSIPDFTKEDIETIRRWNRDVELQRINELPLTEQQRIFNDLILQGDPRPIISVCKKLSEYENINWSLIENTFFKSTNENVISAAATGLRGALVQKQPIDVVERVASKWLRSKSKKIQEAAVFILATKKEILPKDINLVASWPQLLADSKRARDNFSTMLNMTSINNSERLKPAIDLLGFVENGIKNKIDTDFWDEVNTVSNLVTVLKKSNADNLQINRLKALLIYIRDFKPQHNDAPRIAARLLYGLDH